MKNVKYSVKLGAILVIADLLLIISLVKGYLTAVDLSKTDNKDEIIKSYEVFCSVAMLVAQVIFVVLIYFAVTTIKREAKVLKEVSSEIALGKIDIPMDTNGDNELVDILKEYKEVVDNLSYKANVIQEMADCNLDISIRKASSDDAIGIALTKMSQHNCHTMRNIKEAVMQVTTSATQVESASEALAKGAAEQASAVEQITASIDDIADKTKNNANEAGNAADLIKEAVDKVNKGNEYMQDMVVAMQDINKSSEEISKIIKVIDDIAFQTNILALNAAVEAARAGDAGKGFAVVAEEVRNLAAKSSQAAAETAEMIEDSIQKVSVGSQYADDTSKALEQITNVVRQSGDIVQGIATASDQQANAIEQIDKAIEQVSQVVQSNSASSEQCAAASVELVKQSGRVKELLAVYKLGDGDSIFNNKSVKYESPSENESIISLSHAENESIISLEDGFGKY